MSLNELNLDKIALMTDYDAQIAAINELEEAQALGNLPQEILKMTAPNGLIYEHIPETESFHIGDPNYSITAYNVMKAILPDITRSLYKRIYYPEPFYHFGESTRYKIIKAYQRHLLSPKATPETNQFIQFFRYLSGERTGNCFAVQMQFSAAKWACDYDEEEATSLLLHYGWSPQIDPKMSHESMHKLTVVEDGIIIEVKYPHTIQHRVDAACAKAQELFFAHQRNFGERIPPKTADIKAAAVSKFYGFNGYYLSLNNIYSMGIKGKIWKYVDELLNPLTKQEPQYPEVEEINPDTKLPEQVFYLKWDDFLLSEHGNYDLSYEAMSQRMQNNAKSCYETFYPKLKHLPRGVPVHKDLFNAHSTKITAAKKFGFLTPVSKQPGWYIINIKEEEEIKDDTDNQSSNKRDYLSL